MDKLMKVWIFRLLFSLLRMILGIPDERKKKGNQDGANKDTV